MQTLEKNFQRRPFQVGGTLRVDDPTYIERQADGDLYEGLRRGDLCYVLTSRQMGKSSLLVRAKHRMTQAGGRCLALDLTSVGTEAITPTQWYKGICAQLWLGFELGGYGEFQRWWADQPGDGLLQKLVTCVGLILQRYPQQPVVIFVDEIDSVLALPFSVDDFFALIRFTYNQRAVEPAFQRLTFALFGVATPSDLIRDCNRTPFNIGQAITLEGFSLGETQPLGASLGLPADQSQQVLAAILYWTAGQPFLTQKLCYLVWQHNQIHGQPSLGPAEVAHWMKMLIQQQVIHNWEAQDDPEHLRTIRDRILRHEQRAGQLLGLCQKILQQQTLPYIGNEEQTELLLSGLVSRHQGQLHIKNRIYHAIFNADWVTQALAALRPYSAPLQQWVASGKGDDAYLLRGQALTEAQLWQQSKSLTELDYQYLQASEVAKQNEIQQQLERTQLQAENAHLRQQRELGRLKTGLLGVVSAALLAAMGLSTVTWQQYQRAKASEVRALAASSQGLFASDQQLDAMVAAVQAKQALQALLRPDDDTQRQVDQALNQAVFGSNESNRFTRHEGGVLTVDISSDGNTIVTGSNDKTARLWGKDGTLLHTLFHQDTVHRVAFSPTGDRVITGSLDGTLQVWSVDGQKIHHIQAHDQPVWGVAASPDGKFMASASSDRTILSRFRLDQLLQDNSVPLWQQTFDDGATFSIAISSPTSALTHTRDSYIATGSDNGTIKLWTASGILKQSFTAHDSRIWQLAFSPDGNHLVSASEDGTVKLWQVDGTLLNTLVTQRGEIWGVAFSPDGSTIAATSLDDTLHLWRVSDWSYQQIPGQSQGLTRVAFSPDGQTIATGGTDTTVKLWNRDGTLQNTLPGHNGLITSLTFSPDGHYLYSGSDDTQIIAWDLNQIASLNPLEYACNWIGDYLKSVAHESPQRWFSIPRLQPNDGSLCPDHT